MKQTPLTRKTWMRRAPRDTGPSLRVRHIVARRAGEMCEFPECHVPMQVCHHRYERSSGGVGPKSPAAAWINKPVNLLGACNFHNDWCSNQHPLEAWRIGWIVRKGDDPYETPAMTCHHSLPIYLLDNGKWDTFDERNP